MMNVHTEMNGVIGNVIMKKKIGKCALCDKECELTFEHIPPRVAFNSTPAKPISEKELFDNKLDNGEERVPWDIEGLHYQNQQKGMGMFSLCEDCNNNTGSWYGDSYVTFAHIVHGAI